MKTFQTTPRNDIQVAKRLFRQLFIFQSHLDNFTCTSFEQQREAEEIIYMIDELLASMIDWYQPEKE